MAIAKTNNNFFIRFKFLRLIIGLLGSLFIKIIHH